MFDFIRVRFEAARLARMLRKSLTTRANAWKIEREEDGGAAITDGGFKISVNVRRLRILDTVHVYSDGAEVWLPLPARLRLRNAVRLFLARHGNEKLRLRADHKRRRRVIAATSAK
jgi:hypothetical protein